MRRILKCTKDSYITSKIINGVRVTDANVGQAGTLDLYKLYDETTLSGTVAPIELTRVLLKFDLQPIYDITSSININDSSFKCFLKLSDIYGGQPVPSNFTLGLFPLAREFSEGRGSDVVAYRDVDATNWLTSSFSSGTPTLWATSGAYASGALGSTGIDYYHSGALYPSVTSASLGVFQTFNRGDEDLEMDITSLVSGTVAGLIPDYGFRLSFVSAQEQDQYTYFSKRFSSRHVSNESKQPRINLLVNDSISDMTLSSYFDYPNKIFTYNKAFGSYRNFFSGSSVVTGSNSLFLTLLSSKNISVQTSSWSETHSASITYSSSSVSYFSASFSGSQLSFGMHQQTGIYSASFALDTSDPYLKSFLGNREIVKFQPLWQSLDKTVTYTSGSAFVIKKIAGGLSNVANRNFVTNVTNLKHEYTRDETTRLRFFVQDYNTELRHNKIPIDLVSEVYSNIHWRLLNAYSRDVVIPFDTTYNSTKLSSDGLGMYFNLYIADLPINTVYELEFLIRENGQDYLVTNQGFRFKVIP